MYVIERSGVTWGERFYVGITTFFPWSMWGNFDEAHKFERESQAVRMSYRIDEEGFHTTVEDAGIFNQDKEELK